MIDKASGEDPAAYEELAAEDISVVETEWTDSENAFFGAGEALENATPVSDSFDDLDLEPVGRRAARGTGTGFFKRILRR